MSPDEPIASLLPDDESQPGRRSGVGAQSLWDPMAHDAQRKARPRSALTAQNLEQIEARSGYSILVVDDNESARYATARGLRAMGYQTVEAAGGAEALTLAEHASAVVLDVHLPDVHGFEVCRLLRARRRTAQMPIIHTSSIYTQDEHVAAGQGAGADAYLVGAVPSEELAEVLDRLLANGRPPAR